MPQFTSITRSGVRVTMPERVSPCTVTIGGIPITLPAEAGPGIDLVASDVRGDVWAVCTGVANDLGYLLKLSDGSVTLLGDGKVRGRYPAWITEDGDVSWVQESSPYVLRHLDGRKTDTRDTHNPHGPNETLVEDWTGVKVVNVFRHGAWACATYADDPPGLQTVLLRKGDGPVLSADTYRTQLPPHCASHDDGTCTVAVQVPDGFDIPVLVRSERFTPFVPEVEIPDFEWSPHRCAVVVDGEEGFPWFLAHNYRVSGSGKVLGVLHHVPQDKDHLETHEALAREHRTPLYNLADTGNPKDVAFAATSVPSLKMIECYPEPGETDAQFEVRSRALYTIADRWGLFGVYGCGFLGLGTAGVRKEQRVINGLWILGKLRREFPNCRIIVVYTWERSERLRDGLKYLPNVLEAARRLQYSVAKPDDYPTVGELRPSVPVTPPVTPTPTPKPPTPQPEPARPEPIRFLKELLFMTAGAITLMASKFVPSAVLPGRFNYKNDDGSFLSVNNQGEVSTSRNDHANTAFHFVKGTGKAWVWPDPGPFAVKVTFLVDEAD